MRNTLGKLLGGDSLSSAEAEEFVTSIVAGECEEIHIAAALGALRSRGETAEELSGAARAILAHCETLDLGTDAIDVCGTGGDGSGTFNISTAVAFVVAGAGVPVAKHGNRAVSSSCGSADVLEALGVTVQNNRHTAMATADQAAAFTFLFAPAFHSVMASVGPLRKRIGVRTTFNLLGPLMNPAGVRRQVVGVFDLRMLDPMAMALRELGAERAMVLASEDGLDEISLSAPTHIVEVRDGLVLRTVVRPEDAGVTPSGVSTLAGGDPAVNAGIIESILEGRPGAPRDVVIFNAAAALIVAGRAGSFREGAGFAAESIDSGAAGRVLAKAREASGYVAA